jgi:hypothetical protein
MNKKLLLIAIAILAISVASAANVFVSKNEQCENNVVTYTEEVDVYETITHTKPVFVSKEQYFAENDTTATILVYSHDEEVSQELKQGTKMVEKQKTVCVDNSKMEVSDGLNTVVLDYLDKNFECSNTASGMECDSTLDGDGDGKCRSGESCYFVTKEDSCIKIKQQNSGSSPLFETKTVDGVCFIVERDSSFKQDWNLLGGASQ